DGAAVRMNETEYAFEKNGLSCAGAADDHHAFARGDGQVDPPQHAVRSEGLVDVRERDHAEKKTSVRMQLVAMIRTEAATTADLVARPTPCAPRPECIP